MSLDTLCPDPNRVAQLMTGNLSEAELDAIGAHVSACPACTTVLRRLSEEQTVSDGVPPDLSSWSADAEDQEAIERLIAKWRAPDVWNRDSSASTVNVGSHLKDSASETATILNTEELAKQLLQPSTSEGELGWLGPYRVLSVLGVGGMGVVFEADDPHLGRRVAVKAMQPGLHRSGEHKLRFLREARAAASIDHDNIVPIHHVGEEHEVPYLVMPLLKGESLESRLRREGRFSVADAIGIGRQIATGIAAAHARGLIHRDIKPANIWLEDRGQPVPRVKILDFGLARLEDDDLHLTDTGSVAGTPAYMAPEQARGEETDSRSDLFSLGSVLYCLLAGRPPFTGRNQAAMMHAIINHPPGPLTDLEPRVPEKLVSLVMRLLEKDPARRVQRAADVAKALQSLEVEVSSGSVGSHLARPTQDRFPILVAVGVLTIVALVFGLVWFINAQTPQSTAVVTASNTTAQQNAERPVPPPEPALQEIPSDSPFPGLIPRPAPIPGLRRWQVETRAPRGDPFAVAWNPEGRRIAVGSPHGNVRIIDVTTAETLSVIPAHSGSVWAIDWSPTEDRLVTAGDDGAVRLFDSTGKLRQQLGTHVGCARSVAFSRDGTWIASGGFDYKVRLWRTTGETGPVLSGHTSQVDGVAWHPSGQLLGSASLDGTVRIWTLPESTSTEPIRDREAKGHKGAVRGLSWSPDGDLLASAGVDGTIVLSTSDGEPHAVLPAHETPVTAIAWSSNDLIATSGDDKTVVLWHRDGTRVKSQKLNVGRINALQWSHDGSRLAVATDNQGIRLLNETGDWDGAISLDTTVLRVMACNGNGELAIAGEGGSVSVWNPEGIRTTQFRAHDATVNSLSWKSGGELLSADWNQPVRVWDTNGSPLGTREGSTPVAGSPTGGGIAWSSGTEVQLEVPNEPRRILSGHKARLFRIVWHLDGSHLATADVTGEIRAWTRDGTQAGLVKSSAIVTALAWHPQKRLLATGSLANGHIQIHGLDGNLITSWEAHTKGLTALHWSSTGEKLLSSAIDQRVRIWSEEGHPVGELPGPMAIASAVLWNPFRQQIASAHIDGTLSLWDGNTLQPLSTRLLFIDGHWARFDAEGHSTSSDPAVLETRFVVLTEDAHGAIRLMKLSEFTELKSRLRSQ